MEGPANLKPSVASVLALELTAFRTGILITLAPIRAAQSTAPGLIPPASLSRVRLPNTRTSGTSPLTSCARGTVLYSRCLRTMAFHPQVPGRVCQPQGILAPLLERIRTKMNMHVDGPLHQAVYNAHSFSPRSLFLQHSTRAR